MRSNIGCICLTFPHCVLSYVSSNRLHESTFVAFGLSPLCVLKCVWEYFDLQGPWHKILILIYLKKSLNIVNTLQADPEKSRDFIFQNPGIPLVLARFEECAWQSGEDLHAGQKTKERKKRGYYCEKDWFFLPQVHSKKTTSFQEIIILYLIYYYI